MADELQHIQFEGCDVCIIAPEDYEALKKERDRLLALLALDQPWPLADTLAKLIEATEHLLDVHACDGHGHEGYRMAETYGKDALRALREIVAAQSAVSASPKQE